MFTWAGGGTALGVRGASRGGGAAQGGVAGSGLVEGGGDRGGGVVHHRPGQPFRCRFGPWPQLPAAVPAAGRSDDVVRAPRGRLGVVDAGQGSPSACGRVSPRGSAGSASGPAGRRPWRSSGAAPEAASRSP